MFMKTRSVPAIITLLAGFIACLAGIRVHMEVADFLKMLIAVLIVFYLLGCVVKVILDRNFKEIQDEKTTDGEEAQEEDEPVTDEEDAAEAESEQQ